MAIKGALGTTLAISKTKPGTRDVAGYEALNTHTINPTAFDGATDAFTIPAADYATLVTAELVSVSPLGGITGVTAGDQKYLIKLGSNQIALAESVGDALAGTKIALAGTLGGTTRVVGSHYKPCREASNVGEFGREYNVVRVNNLASGATRKFKGSYDNGSFSSDLIFDRDDPGQIVVVEAEKSTATYAFRVGLPGETESDSEEFYFEALVTSVKRIPGGPDDAVMLRINVELDHRDIIEAT